MKLITNIKSPFLSDILFEKSKNFEKIKAAVAYCKNYELFEYCKKQKIKLDYFGRFDDSINLNLEKLKSFLTGDISIHIIGGSKFHPKVIWCYNYGAYIGSANLTKSAWENNIECGLWLNQKELENNHLIDSLNIFFKYIEKESSFLSGISDSTIQEINKHKQKLQSNKENLQIFEKLGISIFTGCSNNKLLRKKDLTDKSSYREDSHWNDLNEMRCLLILKKLEDEDFPQGRQSELCKQMANILNIGLSEGNINFKIGNYKSIAGWNDHSNYSTNTERIYEKYKNTSIKELESIIKDKGKNKGSVITKKFYTKKAEESFYFFEGLRKELEKRKEMRGFKIGKSIGKDYNGATINLKSLGYKGLIKFFRPEAKGNSYLEVCYTYSSPRKFDTEEINNLKKKLFYLTDRTKDKLKLDSDWRPFQFYKEGWGTEQEDKKWIIDRVTDLLKALKDPN